MFILLFVFEQFVYFGRLPAFRVQHCCCTLMILAGHTRLPAVHVCTQSCHSVCLRDRAMYGRPVLGLLQQAYTSANSTVDCRRCGKCTSTKDALFWQLERPARSLSREYRQKLNVFHKLILLLILLLFTLVFSLFLLQWC